MVDRVDEVLEFLASTGKNYTIVDLSITFDMPCDKCLSIVNFLVKYGFVYSNEEEFKINPKIRDIILNKNTEHHNKIAETNTTEFI